LFKKGEDKLEKSIFGLSRNVSRLVFVIQVTLIGTAYGFVLVTFDLNLDNIGPILLFITVSILLFCNYKLGLVLYDKKFGPWLRSKKWNEYSVIRALLLGLVIAVTTILGPTIIIKGINYFF